MHEPVFATIVQPDRFFGEETPGAIAFATDNTGLKFHCPCGCGSLHVIPFKGHGEPNWTFDGNHEKPTLTPSIRSKSGCKMHVNLTAGVWQFHGDSGQ